MKKHLIFGLALTMLALVAMLGQSTYTTSATASAYSYGYWSLVGQAANTYTFTPTSLCTQAILGGGGPFPAFSSFGVGGSIAPVYINDTGTPGNSERVTPTAVLTCGVTISPVHTHTTFSLQSGTAGLQEALNQVAVTAAAYPIQVLLDRNWYAQAVTIAGITPANIITSVKGSAAAYLEDVTTVPHTLYVWNGTAYASGTWTNALPAVAAGAAAGTSPAISVSGTAGVGVVQLTTGTSPSTGTLFTITWPTSGSFTYAPSCTMTVTNTTYTTFTNAQSYSAGAASSVATATTAPAASTVYLFAYGCK